MLFKIVNLEEWTAIGKKSHHHRLRCHHSMALSRLGTIGTTDVVGEYTVFTMGNPLRSLKIHSFGRRMYTQVERCRIHSFHYRKSLEEPKKEYTFFWWRIHKLHVGEYTICTIGNPLTPYCT
jgi:hypothetical protein